MPWVAAAVLSGTVPNPVRTGTTAMRAIEITNTRRGPKSPLDLLMASVVTPLIRKVPLERRRATTRQGSSEVPGTVYRLQPQPLLALPAAVRMLPMGKAISVVLVMALAVSGLLGCGAGSGSAGTSDAAGRKLPARTARSRSQGVGQSAPISKVIAARQTKP